MFDAAHKTALKEFEDDWLIGPYPLPPAEPCRVIPSNVAVQNKPTVDDEGRLSQKVKARVTANLTFGDEESPNSGVRRGDRTTGLPSHQSHTNGAAITDSAFRRAGVAGAQYCTDLTGAFSFLQLQRLDWWLQVRYWVLFVGASGTREAQTLAGYYFQPRLLFGGGWGPNRFMRVQRCKRARVVKRQAAFDAACPYPQEVIEVVKLRTQMQQDGILPAGVEQVMMASLQEFIDDESGSSGSDSVPMPMELAHIDVAEIARRTLESGARPAAVDSRVMVHCCFSIDESERIGLEHSIEKVQCGDAIVVLGLRADIEADVSDCPPSKAMVMVAELEFMAGQVERKEALDREMVERNTGRLTNISQIEPSLVLHLHAGYALSTSMSKATEGKARRRLKSVHVRGDSVIGREFRALLAAAIELLTANEGVPLLHVAAFPAQGTPGTLAVVTDASGEDGVGGYAFHADLPGWVFVVASAWPADVLAAIVHSMRPAWEKAAMPAEPSCSMPAAETFGAWGVAETVRRAELGSATRSELGLVGSETLPCVAVMAGGDCKPASSALTNAKSKSALMKDLVVASRETCEKWMGVQVIRKWNTDADLLSHPDEVWKVVQAAREANLRVATLPVHPFCFDTLRRGIASAFARKQQAGER